jgi:hypothetical protein
MSYWFRRNYAIFWLKFQELLQNLHWIVYIELRPHYNYAETSNSFYLFNFSTF